MNTDRRIKIAFRADMNSKISSGHVMRCLSVADEFCRKGIECIFISADDKSKKVLIDRGYDSISLDARWDDLSDELDAIKDLVLKEGITHLVVDSYFAEDCYYLTLKKCTKVIAFDDFRKLKGVADRVVWYGPDVGFEYAPLRGCFRNLKKRTFDGGVKTILLLSGGYDDYCVKDTMIEKLLDRISDANIVVVCGRDEEQYLRLKRLYENDSRVILYGFVGDIAELMMQADFCISAAGTTLVELCACGTPTISYYFAENQKGGAEEFDRINVIPCIGDARKRLDFERLDKELAHLSIAGERESVSGRMREKVDGRGCERIVEMILSI